MAILFNVLKQHPRRQATTFEGLSNIDYSKTLTVPKHQLFKNIDRTKNIDRSKTSISPVKAGPKGQLVILFLLSSSF